MKQWYKNRKKDHFYVKAKKNDLISRAYYKIEEIDKKYNIFENSNLILDIGCSPGGWIQYALTKKNLKVVGIDILPMKKIFSDRFTFYEHDLNKIDEIDEIFKKNNYLFDVIISDIAPNTSGNQFLDQVNSYNLSNLSFNFVEKYLKRRGHFLVKNFQGGDTDKLFKEIKSIFSKCSYLKPDASDKKSKEIYILGLEKK